MNTSTNKVDGANLSNIFQDYFLRFYNKKDDLLIFEDYKTEAGSTEKQIHELFLNGDVFFAIDEDVYQNDYMEVLKSD